MVQEFNGVIKEEDLMIYEQTLNHLKRRLSAFRRDALITEFGLAEAMEDDICYEIGLIDELLECALPNVEGFGVGKPEKLDDYNRIVSSAFKLFKEDLLKMKDDIKHDDLAESKLRLIEIECSLSEVERVLSTYKFSETK